MRYTVFTGAGCKWCVQAIKLLADKGLVFDVVAIKGNKEALKFLGKQGLTTVPQIFQGETLIGGYDDAVEHFKGE